MAEPHLPGRSKGAIWEHFDVAAPRINSNSHPRARCKYCQVQMHGQPKAKMVPHLIRCPQVPNDVRLEWLKAPSDTKHPPISTHSSSAPVPASETESGAAENVEMADPPAPVRPPERPGSYPQSHSQHLEVLRIKANVAKFKAKAMEAKYQAMAMEAEFMAEKMAARVKLQGMGIPEVEIDQLIE